MAHDGAGALAPATIAVRGGFEPELGEGIVPPIHVASTFLVPGDPLPGRPSYGRGGSPGVLALAAALAFLLLPVAALFLQVPPGTLLGRLDDEVVVDALRDAAADDGTSEIPVADRTWSRTS